MGHIILTAPALTESVIAGILFFVKEYPGSPCSVFVKDPPTTIFLRRTGISPGHKNQAINVIYPDFGVVRSFFPF
jgi:hypothetical protein